MDNQYINKSLERGLDILEMFIGGDNSWGVRELAREIKSSPTTTYRLLHTLAKSGYLEKDSLNNKYRLGSKVISFAESYNEQNPVQNIARKVFLKYSKNFEHNFYLGKLLNQEIVYLVTHEGKGPIVISVQPGVSVELYCTALGKILLAYQDEDYIEDYLKNSEFKAHTETTITDPNSLRESLKKTRSRGYAINNGERHDGIAAIGFPLFKTKKETTMAISIAYPQFYVNNHYLELNSLIEMCENITKEISSRLPNF